MAVMMLMPIILNDGHINIIAAISLLPLLISHHFSPWNFLGCTLFSQVGYFGLYIDHFGDHLVQANYSLLWNPSLEKLIINK